MRQISSHEMNASNVLSQGADGYPQSTQEAFGLNNKGLDEVPGISKVTSWYFLSTGRTRKMHHLSCFCANTALAQKSNLQRLPNVNIWRD